MSPPLRSPSPSFVSRSVLVVTVLGAKDLRRSLRKLPDPYVSICIGEYDHNSDTAHKNEVGTEIPAIDAR